MGAAIDIVDEKTGVGCRQGENQTLRLIATSPLSHALFSLVCQRLLNFGGDFLENLWVRCWGRSVT